MRRLAAFLLAAAAMAAPARAQIVPCSAVSDQGSKILLDHPQTKDRILAINAAADASPSRIMPLLTPAEWAALKRICG